MGLGPPGGWSRAEISFPCERWASWIEKLCENDTLGCKKRVELHALAFCMICPAVMNDDDSIDDNFTLPQSIPAK